MLAPAGEDDVTVSRAEQDFRLVPTIIKPSSEEQGHTLRL